MTTVSFARPELEGSKPEAGSVTDDTDHSSVSYIDCDLWLIASDCPCSAHKCAILYQRLDKLYRRAPKFIQLEKQVQSLLRVTI